MLNQQSLDNVIVKTFLDKIDGEDEGRDDCINALVQFQNTVLDQVQKAVSQGNKMIAEISK